MISSDKVTSSERYKVPSAWRGPAETGYGAVSRLWRLAVPCGF